MKATHPSLGSGYQTNALLTQGESGGKIFATIPAGTNPSVQIEFTLDSGSLKVAGQTVNSPATIDLSAVDTVYHVDPVGFEYPYALDIATAGAAPIISKKDPLAGTIAIADGTVSYSEPLASTPMEIRGRGNSTCGYKAEKKPYRMKFSSALAMLDMPAATD